MFSDGFYVFFVFIVIYHVVGPIALIYRRHSVYIEKRDWKPLMVLSVVNLFTAVSTFLNLSPLWGIAVREKSCILTAFSLPMSIFTFVGIYFMRCLFLFKLYYYNQTKVLGYKNLDGFEKSLLSRYVTKRGSGSKSANQSSDSMNLQVKKASGGWKRAIGIPMIIILFGFVFGAAYSGFRCVDTLPIIFTMVSLYTIMTFTFFVLLRKVKDPYLVKFEMLASSLLFFVLIFASGAHFALLGKMKNPSAADTALPGIYPFIIVIMSNTLSFIMPVVLSYKKKIEKSQDIKSLIRNKQEWEAFSKICADYFCLENSLFLFQYDMIKSTPAKESIDMLYNEFIASGSRNEINLSGKLRSKIKSSMDNSVDEIMLNLDLAEKEVIKILEQNVMRYYLSASTEE
eukprot:NODE_88_length_21932_cov_0.317867.p4 type:complete len:399 gc:universal NODE_88_length_21932_cov_0.317867:15465-14269(-)